MENNQKYYKKALKTLGLGFYLKTHKTIEDLKKEISSYETTKEVLISNIEISKENLIVCKRNIEHLRNEIIKGNEYKENETLTPKQKKELLEAIKECEYEIQDNEDIILDAQNTLSEAPKMIVRLTEYLETYLYNVEPQMKIERFKDLNKGKNYSYSIV